MMFKRLFQLPVMMFFVKARYQAGRVSVAANLSARASSLDARIRLKREQLRQPE